MVLRCVSMLCLRATETAPAEGLLSRALFPARLPQYAQWGAGGECGAGVGLRGCGAGVLRGMHHSSLCGCASSSEEKIRIKQTSSPNYAPLLPAVLHWGRL